MAVDYIHFYYVAPALSLHKNSTAKLLFIARHLPSLLLDQFVHFLFNFGSRSRQLFESQLVKRSRRLDVVKSLLQVVEFSNNFFLRGPGAFQGLCLKCFNGLQLLGNVISHRLEALECRLNLVNDLLVLEHRPVVGKVDLGRLAGEVKRLFLCIVVSLAERLQRASSGSREAQRRNDFGPVEFDRFLVSLLLQISVYLQSNYVIKRHMYIRTATADICDNRDK